MIRPPIPKPAHRRRGISRRSPFPLAIGTSTGRQLESEIVYRGRFHGNSIHIFDPEHVRNLYSMGFFGKGMFSKSAPVHVASYDAITNTSLPASGMKQNWQADQQHNPAEGSQEVPQAQVNFILFALKQSKSRHYDERKGEDIAMVTDSDSETEKGRVMQDLQDVLSEPLVMTFVEAFFLSYGLGCLLVDEESDGTAGAVLLKPYNLEELWHRFCQLDANFVDNYVAYHHFRSKGWVPRSGIKFGTDFVLYKEGPPFYHASYSVLVRPIRDHSKDPKEFGWSALAGLNRITEQAAKELLLCQVIWPQDVDVMTPNCLSRFKVQETLVKRWVSNEERVETEIP